MNRLFRNLLFSFFVLLVAALTGCASFLAEGARAPREGGNSEEHVSSSQQEDDDEDDDEDDEEEDDDDDSEEDGDESGGEAAENVAGGETDPAGQAGDSRLSPGDAGPEEGAVEQFQQLKTWPAQNGAIRSIQNRGVLRVGVQRTYQPFYIAPYHVKNPNPNYPGIDADVAEVLADTLGVRLEIVAADSIPELFRMVQEGKIDMAFGGVSATLQRARYVSFSDPYIITSPAGLLRKDALPPESEGVDFPRRRLNSLSDLRSVPTLRIGVRSGTTTEQIVRGDATFQRHEVRGFQDRAALLSALENREIDVLVGDQIYIRALLLKQAGLLGAFQPLLETYREDHLSVVLPQGQPDLTLFVNFFLKEMNRTGRIKAILDRYLESDGWLQQ